MSRPYLNNLTDIGVDGGVGPSNVDRCCASGANMIVSGSAITQADDYKLVIDRMKQITSQFAN